MMLFHLTRCRDADGFMTFHRTVASVYMHAYHIPVPGRKLLVKYTSDVQFSFNGMTYRQVDGVAMGSTLGPILTNAFLGYCESSIKRICSLEHLAGEISKLETTFTRNGYQLSLTQRVID